jgi:hypothetical protein
MIPPGGQRRLNSEAGACPKDEVKSPWGSGPAFQGGESWVESVRGSGGGKQSIRSKEHHAVPDLFGVCLCVLTFCGQTLVVTLACSCAICFSNSPCPILPGALISRAGHVTLSLYAVK